MSVVFVIVIRKFNSCPFPIKYEGVKQKLIFLGKLGWKCEKESVKGKHLDTESLELGCLVTVVCQCLSQCLARHGHRYTSLYLLSPSHMHAKCISLFCLNPHGNSMKKVLFLFPLQMTKQTQMGEVSCPGWSGESEPELKPWMSDSSTWILNLRLRGLIKHQGRMNEWMQEEALLAWGFPTPSIRTVTGRPGEGRAVSIVTKEGGRNIFFWMRRLSLCLLGNGGVRGWEENVLSWAGFCWGARGAGAQALPCKEKNQSVVPSWGFLRSTSSPNLPWGLPVQQQSFH